MKSHFVYHLCQKETWRRAVGDGEYAGSELDLSDGFIHFSAAGQVKQTARLHLAGVKGLVLLKVNANKLGDSLLWETSRSGELFPHLYGRLAPDLVDSATELQIDGNGNHIFPAIE